MIENNEKSTCVINVEGDKFTNKASEYIPEEVNLYEELSKFGNTKDNVAESLSLEDSCLSDQAKFELKLLITKYSKAFVESDGIIGHFKGPIRHQIDLVDENAVVRSRPYRVPAALQDEVKKQIENMLAQNIIKRSNSPFASPILLVKKEDKKSYRFCVDYRKLNSITKKQTYYLPLIQEIIDRVSSKQIFSCFDFQSGFHQIE